MRCSPFKQADRRAGFIQAEASAARRNIFAPFGSVASASSSRNGVAPGQSNLSEQADASNAEDRNVQQGSDAVDRELSHGMRSVHVSSGRTPQGVSRSSGSAGDLGEVGTNALAREPSGMQTRAVQNIAMRHIDDNLHERSLHSSDMISPIRHLNSLTDSLSDINSRDVVVDSVLGKRTADQKDEATSSKENSTMALVVHSAILTGGAQKKGKHKEIEEDEGMAEDRTEYTDQMVEKEATGSGAAGHLVGPTVAPRQKQ